MTVVLHADEADAAAQQSHRDGRCARVQRVVHQLAHRGCRALDVPVIVTEQYPQGLGPTIEELGEALDGIDPIEKRAFSALGAPSLRKM